jgi:hypothetical protein
MAAENVPVLGCSVGAEMDHSKKPEPSGFQVFGNTVLTTVPIKDSGPIPTNCPCSHYKPRKVTMQNMNSQRYIY